MTTKLGLQIYSVRNTFEIDPVGTLERVAQIGYKYLQVNSFNISPEGMTFGKDLSAEALRKLLDRFGLQAVSAHFRPTHDMRLETIAEDLHVLGITSLADAAEFWATPQEVNEWNRRFNQYGETLKKLGIQFYYHNHFHEFQVLGNRSIFEMIVEDTDKDLVKLEFDTYWAVRGGQDPIYWLKKLGTRCDLIHQKDLPPTGLPVNLFEKYGYDTELQLDVIRYFKDPKDFTEVGDGLLNIPAYIEAARKYNQAEYIFIEQDVSSKTELESIAVSYEKMNELMR